MSSFSMLIIDDNEEDRYILGREFGDIGLSDVKVFEACNGKEALEFLRDYETKRREFKEDFPPLIIFLDINMPLVNGFQFLEQFSEMKKENSGYRDCVVLMFSSSEIQEERDKAMSYSFVKDFIVKGGYSIDKLEAIIQQIASESLASN